MQKKDFQSLMRVCEKESAFFFVCIVLILLIAGVIYSFFLGSDLRYWDEEHYLLLAKNLGSGIYSFNGADPTAFQPPGYPFILYALSWLSSSLVFLRFANFIFLSCGILCLFLMLKREEDNLTALVGALMAAVYPLFFYTAGTFFPQTVASMLFLAILLVISSRHSSWQKEFSAGLLLGGLFLIIPSFLLYLPLWMLYPWFVHTSKKWRPLGLLLLGCFFIVGCWTARNALTFDRFVLISSNSGINLLLGNSAHTTPEAGVNTMLDPYLAAGKNMNEFEQDAYFTKTALRWIKENPGDALALFFLKALNFFNFKNELASKSEESAFKDGVAFISYYPLLLLCVIRLCMAGDYPLKLFEKYLALFLFVSPFLQAIFFTRIRFRVPFDMLMIYFSACTLSIIMKRRKWV